MSRKRKMKYRHHGYRFRNITFLVLSIVVAVILVRYEVFHSYLLHLGNLELVGAFIAGVFFTSSFTIAPASVILLILAENLPVWLLAPLAGLGGMVGDYVMFQFFKNEDMAWEIHQIFKGMGGKRISHLLHTKYLRWTLPVIGAAIVASPFPDELGIALMGISKLKTPYFLILTFLLDTLAVCLLMLFSPIIKP